SEVVDQPTFVPEVEERAVLVVFQGFLEGGCEREMVLGEGVGEAMVADEEVVDRGGQLWEFHTHAASLSRYLSRAISVIRRYHASVWVSGRSGFLYLS